MDREVGGRERDRSFDHPREGGLGRDERDREQHRHENEERGPHQNATESCAAANERTRAGATLTWDC